MKKHRCKTAGRLSAFLSLLLVATMAQPLFQSRAAENDVTMDGNVTWSYLDDGSDPAGDSTAAGYDRTSWTKDGYDVSAWKTATGSFGAKKGKINDLGGGCTPKTLLTQYKTDGTTDIEAFFFRTDVTIPDASKVTKISGSVIYDDAATVYVNGVKIAGFDDDSITGNLQYGGSNAGDPKTMGFVYWYCARSFVCRIGFPFDRLLWGKSKSCGVEFAHTACKLSFSFEIKYLSVVICPYLAILPLELHTGIYHTTYDLMHYFLDTSLQNVPLCAFLSFP